MTKVTLVPLPLLGGSDRGLTLNALKWTKPGILGFFKCSSGIGEATYLDNLGQRRICTTIDGKIDYPTLGWISRREPHVTIIIENY
jgi:hypothetical protein